MAYLFDSIVMTSKKDFERILERYLNGTATEQEIKWVEKWYSTLDSTQDDPLLDERDEKILHQHDWQDIQKGSAKKIAAFFSFGLLWPPPLLYLL